MYTVCNRVWAAYHHHKLQPWPQEDQGRVFHLGPSLLIRSLHLKFANICFKENNSPTSIHNEQKIKDNCVCSDGNIRICICIKACFACITENVVNKKETLAF